MQTKRSKIAEEESVETKPKKGLSGKFIEFMKERGDDRVSNPNPKSRDRFPNVKVKSLSSSKEGQELVKKMFKDWLRDLKEPEPSKNNGPEQSLKELPPLKTKGKKKEKTYFKVSNKDVENYITEHEEVFRQYEEIISRITDDEIEQIYEDQNIERNSPHGKVRREMLPIVSKDEKKAVATGHIFGRLISDHLEKKYGEKYSNLLGKTKGWVYGSSGGQVSMLQGVLSRAGVKGYTTKTSDSDESLKIYRRSKSKEDFSMDINESSYDTKEVLEVVKEVYTASQAFFKRAGLTHINVFRGVTDQIDQRPPDVGDTVSIKSRELSSWTTDPFVGIRFGRVVYAKIPVQNVLGGFITDPVYGGNHSTESKYKESELMVLESSGIEAKVISPGKYE